MKTITLPWLDPCDPSIPGIAVELPVYLDWFKVPEEHILANAVAVAAGEPEPFPDPNLVTVRLERRHEETG